MLHQYLLGHRLNDAKESQNKAQANQQMIEADKQQLCESATTLCEKPHALWFAFAGGAALGYLKPKTHLSLLSGIRILSFLKP